MKKRTRLSMLLVCLLSTFAVSATNSAYFRFPSIHHDTLVFAAEGDLWNASLAGGQAHRLTTNAAEETRPAISPDGKWVAFSASYEGATEVYVMPIAGGLPKRVTFENFRAYALGWTPTGQVLYSTFGGNGPASQRIVASVDPNTLARHVFPLADANDAVLDDSGTTLYFVRFGLAVTNDNARHYRGGAISQLWRYDLRGDGEAQRIGPTDVNLRRPMWWQGRLVVVSDKDGHDNLWSLQPDGSDMQPLTAHRDFDVRSASLSEGRIAYQLGADIHLFDLGSHQDQTLDIALTSDFEQERERWLKQPLSFATSTHLAPDAEHVAITVRGHVVLAGTGELRRIEITQPKGSRLRNAVVSHDGKWVYAICDATGENEVWQFPADGRDGGKALTHDGDFFRTRIEPSPDGKLLAHADKKGRLWLYELATGKNTLIDDGSTTGQGEHAQIVWSPDSQAVAFVRSNSSSERSQLALYSLAARKTTWLTDNKFDSFAPAFSPDGHWLYFLSDREFQLSNRAPWGDRNTGPYFIKRGKVYALALQAGERFPFQPDDELKSSKQDDDAKASAENTEKARSEKKKDDAKDAHKLPGITLDGLAERLYAVPTPAGNYGDLATDGKRLYLLDTEANTLNTLAVDNKGAEQEPFMGDIKEFSLSQDGKKVFLRRNAPKGVGPMFIVEAGAKAPADLAKLSVAIGDWSLRIDPREEWRQLFNDAWRMHRDFFYDPAMRGRDWNAIHAKYAPLVERVTERAELDDVLGQMSAELGALHSQIAPGEERAPTDVAASAGLGADLERAAGGWRVAHIYRTDPDLPTERAPLQAPGIDVREGDIIVSVNGQASAKVRDFSDLLRNQAGQQVLLEIKRGEATHKEIVKPVPQMQQLALHYGDWEQRNRERVDHASGGKLGYLHLRAMGSNDIANFAREFYAQYNRDGLIIDVRRNNGGNIDSWVIEKLMRRVWAFWKPPYTQTETNMQQTFRGHLVVLTDSLTYSDGETFSAGIKALKLAPLIGTRTAGAGVWLDDDNSLADRGMARVAESPQFGLDGQWLVENVGVAPDIEVDNPPHATFMGEDKQLDAGIAWLQQQLKDKPIRPLVPMAIPPIKDTP